MVRVHLHEVSRTGTFIEAGSRIAVSTGFGRRWGGVSVSWYRVSVWEDEKILELENAYGCTTL